MMNPYQLPVVLYTLDDTFSYTEIHLRKLGVIRTNFRWFMKGYKFCGRCRLVFAITNNTCPLCGVNLRWQPQNSKFRKKRDVHRY